MKNWMRRFGVLAVLSAMICGVVVAGCGDGDNPDEGAATNNAPAKADGGDEQ